jgi:hypothetical protein
MDLGMLDCLSLKTRALLGKIMFDMNRNSETYVIPMHRKSFWTNQWMQDPRKKLLQAIPYDPSTQYKKS